MSKCMIKQKINVPFIDIYKITWKYGAQSHIHDHSKYGCIMYLQKGLLEEKIYNKRIINVKSRYILENSVTYIHNDIGYHKITPIHDSVSYHFYFPKGYKTKTFNENK
jgi:hypothetical protein